MKKIILIPALNPNHRLSALVVAICNREPEIKIIIVNDGSDEICKAIFDSLLSLPQVQIISHPYNMGKGQALKTAIKEALNDTSGIERMITADADGQHKVDDILKLCNHPMPTAPTLLLGVRVLGKKNIPLRSLAGNSIMRLMFRCTTGICLQDTQTGLRGFNPVLAKNFLELTSTGFDFEMDMLFLCKQKNFNICECPIESVYLARNVHSHFKPIRDSLRILLTITKFASSRLCDKRR